MYSTSLFRIFLFIFLALHGAVAIKPHLDGPAAPGVSGVYHDKAKGQIYVYYGTDVEQHAKHVAATVAGKSFLYVRSKKEQDDNRRIALKGIPTQKGKVRDEKPPACLSYRSLGIKASVELLPKTESDIEGALLSEVARTLGGAAAAYRSNDKIQLIDNRINSSGHNLRPRPGQGGRREKQQQGEKANPTKREESEDILAERDFSHIGPEVETRDVEYAFDFETRGIEETVIAPVLARSLLSIRDADDEYVFGLRDRLLQRRYMIDFILSGL